MIFDCYNCVTAFISSQVHEPLARRPWRVNGALTHASLITCQITTNCLLGISGTAAAIIGFSNNVKSVYHRHNSQGYKNSLFPALSWKLMYVFRIYTPQSWWLNGFHRSLNQRFYIYWPARLRERENRLGERDQSNGRNEWKNQQLPDLLYKLSDDQRDGFKHVKQCMSNHKIITFTYYHTYLSSTQQCSTALCP